MLEIRFLLSLRQHTDNLVAFCSCARPDGDTPRRFPCGADWQPPHKSSAQSFIVSCRTLCLGARERERERTSQCTYHDHDLCINSSCPTAVPEAHHCSLCLKKITKKLQWHHHCNHVSLPHALSCVRHAGRSEEEWAQYSQCSTPASWCFVLLSSCESLPPPLAAAARGDDPAAPPNTCLTPLCVSCVTDFIIRCSQCSPFRLVEGKRMTQGGAGEREARCPTAWCSWLPGG